MELSIHELGKDALLMPDKRAARHFAHDISWYKLTRCPAPLYRAPTHALSRA